MPDEIRSLDGKILPDNYSVTFTPEIYFWLNSKSGKAIHRKTFFQKIIHLLEDIETVGFPKRGHAKTIREMEVPVFYIRLENDEGLRILYDWSKHQEIIEIRVLAVSNKKEFQSKLRRSAEHIVHASSFDRLDWIDDDSSEVIDLKDCRLEDLEELFKRAKVRFGTLPVKEKDDGWTEERYKDRSKRATIYDFIIPNTMDYGVLKENQDFELPAILKLQDHQKKLMHYDNDKFLLEGVAGTGKTTILLYRFVNDIKHSRDQQMNPEKEIIFVTHNERLKKDILASIKLFFPKEEHEMVSRCVKTINELFKSLVLDINNYNPKNELTRRKFHTMFDKNELDLDLFWEEYRGVLRGYNLKGSSYILGPKEYQKIGRRRGRIEQNKRNEFFEIANDAISGGKNFSSIGLNKDEIWDSLDLCREVLQRIDNDDLERPYQCLYIDEVQDLTRAEMEILLLLLNPDGLRRFAVAGDLSQSIQPSSFTWQALSDLIFEVLGIKIGKHETLVENYRSTPYLVDSANYILKLQSQLDFEGTSELQRPFAGENSGDPGLIFFEDEENLIQLLNKNKLPNPACPMLVRDKKTKEKLEKRIENSSNIITIAKFKGLERGNVLLWSPQSGSEGILDLRSDPIRGKFASKREFSNSTALLELRHVFVGFTRARVLMGILAPKNEYSYFLKEITEKTNSLIEASHEKLEIFAEELSNEDLLEYAIEYMNAGLYDMAAEAFRNINDEHNFHFCKGQEFLEKQEYDFAIHHLYNASKNDTGENSNDAGIIISEIADVALDSTEDRPLMIAKILSGAKELSKKSRFRLQGEKEEDREDFEQAAKNYIQAEDHGRAKFCINKISDYRIQTGLYLEIEDTKSAHGSFKKYIEHSLSKEIAVNIALAHKKTTKMIFKGPLLGLKKEFNQIDIEWAQKLSKGNKDLESIVKDRINEGILKRVNNSASQEFEVMKLLIKTNNTDEFKKRNNSKFWKFIQNDAEIELMILTSNLSEALRNSLEFKDLKNIEKYVKRIAKATTEREPLLGLYYILRDNDITINNDLVEESNYLSNLKIIEIIARTVRNMPTEYLSMLSELEYMKNSANRDFSRFSIKWSCVLINYLIRKNQKLTEENIFLVILDKIILENKRSHNEIYQAILLYIERNKLNKNDSITKRLERIWNLSSDDIKSRITFELFLLNYDLAKSLPFDEIHLGFIEHLKLVRDKMKNERPIMFKNMKNEIKEERKEILKMDLINNKIDFEDSRFSRIKPKQIKMILKQEEVQEILGLGIQRKSSKREGKNIKQNVNSVISIENLKNNDHHELDDKVQDEQKIEHENEESNEIISNENIVEEQEIADVFDTAAFLVNIEEEKTELYPENFWNEINQENSKEHIGKISKLIQGQFLDDDFEQQRKLILSYVDSVLPGGEFDSKTIEPHIKFAVIISVERISILLRDQYVKANVIPPSTQQEIRLFKQQNTRVILQSKTTYSQQVLNF